MSIGSHGKVLEGLVLDRIAAASAHAGACQAYVCAPVKRAPDPAVAAALQISGGNPQGLHEEFTRHKQSTSASRSERDVMRGSLSTTNDNVRRAQM